MFKNKIKLVKEEKHEIPEVKVCKIEQEVLLYFDLIGLRHIKKI